MPQDLDKSPRPKRQVISSKMAALKHQNHWKQQKHCRGTASNGSPHLGSIDQFDILEMFYSMNLQDQLYPGTGTHLHHLHARWLRNHLEMHLHVPTGHMQIGRFKKPPTPNLQLIIPPVVPGQVESKNPWCFERGAKDKRCELATDNYGQLIPSKSPNQ